MACSSCEADPGCEHAGVEEVKLKELHDLETFLAGDRDMGKYGKQPEGAEVVNLVEDEENKVGSTSDLKGAAGKAVERKSCKNKNFEKSEAWPSTQGAWASGEKKKSKSKQWAAMNVLVKFRDKDGVIM
ncbi:hypothetical protein BSKO_12928 [Bryopsis sp. KO-2023]|nr:hypothetical protein BSKO_12928 [Bryopsis sp. KO-2023]